MAKFSATLVCAALILMTFFNFMLWTKTSDAKKSRMSKLLLEKQAEDQRNQVAAKAELALFEKMKAYSIQQVPVRKQVLRGVLNKTIGGKMYADLYETLAAEVECPEKIRVGTMGDGGKWTCNPWKVPRDSVMLSFGLRDFIGFEIDWQKMLSNRSIIYGFDAKEQASATKKKFSRIRGQSNKALVSPKTNIENGEFTMTDLAKALKVKDVEILKIDIEGAEKNCLIPFLEVYPVCQMYVEMHGESQEHAKLLQKIAHLKYRLFSYEVNGDTMTACEYSFIREDCIDKYGGKRIANYLDFKN